MNTDPHWTTYLSALLAPVIAVLGSFIAFRQWRTAQNKLKYDLFERRFSVYQSTRDFLNSIMSSGKAKDEEIIKFQIAIREAKWLTSDKLAMYLNDEIFHKAIDLATLQAELEGVPVGDKRSENVRGQAELKKWLIAQYRVLDEKFTPFLKLQH